MKIAIIGAGAVGGYFGARLAHAGNKVTFLARGKHLEILKTQGLLIKSILGDFKLGQVHATDSIPSLGQSDLVLLAVKAWQIKEIRDQLKHIIHSESILLPLQNGVLAVGELQEALDKERVIGGVCRIISKIESPGVINHFGATPTIVFGELDGSVSSRIKELGSLFDQAEVNCKLSEDISADIWKKFGFICTGGIMAITRCDLGVIRELAETRTLLRDLIAEICLLAAKEQVQMGEVFVENTLNFIDTLPPETTYSMARDIWEGRPSELDYLNGAVVRLGQTHEVPTPLNNFVYSALKPLEIKARSQSSDQS